MNDEPRRPGTARLLAKNTLYNLGTQVLLVIVSFLSFPVIVRGVSAEGFGLLSLIWVLIGYFSLLDLGVSRAITKFIAEYLARDEERRIHDITWTSLSMSVILGLLVGLVILSTRELVLSSLFHVAGTLRAEAKASLLIAAVGIPFMLAQGILRGVQTAYQRFDLVNGFQAAMGGMQWLGSIVIVLAGGGVREIVLLTVASRVLAVGASLAILPRMMPGIFARIRFWDSGLARNLLSFGGWVSLSQATGPLFLYVDRLMIATFMALPAVAYYTVPQETVSRMLILPLSMTAALYPVLSGWSTGMKGSELAGAAYARAVKYVALLILPPAVLLFGFSQEILRAWMGAEFAGHGSLPLQILLVGLLFNAVSQIPVTALHAYGRPDLPAKFNLVELPVMIGLNLLLIPMFGIAGAAVTWSLRVMLDAVLLFRAARPYSRGVGFMPQKTEAVRGMLALVTLLAFLVAVENPWARVAAACVFIVAYGFGVWKHWFDETDRVFVLELKGRLLG